jgi:hypothetical protein
MQTSSSLNAPGTFSPDQGQTPRLAIRTIMIMSFGLAGVVIAYALLN